MIRVFLLASLGLVAVVILARHLSPAPAAGPTATGAVEAVGSSDSAGAAQAARSPDAPRLSRWEGVWEGTFTAYRRDGTIAQTSRARHEHTRVSDVEQRVRITDRHPDGRTSISTARILVRGDGLECEVAGPDGSVERLTGRMDGDSLVWRGRDDATGVEETIREEVIASPGGDVYLVHGVSSSRRSAQNLLIFEGRYLRAE